jgi:hypothetical protein
MGKGRGTCMPGFRRATRELADVMWDCYSILFRLAVLRLKPCHRRTRWSPAESAESVAGSPGDNDVRSSLNGNAEVVRLHVGFDMRAYLEWKQGQLVSAVGDVAAAAVAAS